mmetsp:Transcript_25374/g.59034  ORF Transcript_25374/g.59034 Transcript_25374/m.59034 type:complete len:221 (-) Transcript_25374:81-743(-)
MQAVEYPGRRGWCGVSCGNMLQGKRERRQAESIYLDEQWAPGVQQLLLQDVVADELHAAIHDESLSDEEVYSDSDDARGSESGSVTSESQSDGSDGSSDGDFEPASSDTDGESEPSSTESSSWDEPEFITSDESSGDETDATARCDPMELESDEGESSEEGMGSTALFEWFEGLEVTTNDWDEFNANLSDLRWRMRPRDLPDAQFYISWANGTGTGVSCA